LALLASTASGACFSRGGAGWRFSGSRFAPGW
jgi:hypothetical protein